MGNLDCLDPAAWADAPKGAELAGASDSNGAAQAIGSTTNSRPEISIAAEHQQHQALLVRFKLARCYSLLHTSPLHILHTYVVIVDTCNRYNSVNVLLISAARLVCLVVLGYLVRMVLGDLEVFVLNTFHLLTLSCRSAPRICAK